MEVADETDREGAEYRPRLLQSYGPENIKRYLWNREFLVGRWNCLDKTAGDCIYAYIEKYARHGSILDLGCGSGNTAAELASDSYAEYVGVDISDVAVEKATIRGVETGSHGKTTYVQADISAYEPSHLFDLILFRDSLYYIPRPRIAPMLQRYAGFLSPGGCFVVRMWDSSPRCRRILTHIEKATL